MAFHRIPRWSDAQDRPSHPRVLRAMGLDRPEKIKIRGNAGEDIDLGPLGGSENSFQVERLYLCADCRGFFISSGYHHNIDAPLAGVMFDPLDTVSSSQRPWRRRNPELFEHPELRVSFALPQTENRRWDLWFEAKQVGRECRCMKAAEREQSRREVDEMMRFIVEQAERASGKK